MSCVARPHQTPIGTASNFLQCKWVSCSKSYWQGYDPIGRAISWPLVFRSQIYGWRDVHQGRGQLSESLLSYPPRQASSSSKQQQAAAGKKQASKQQAAKQRASQQASKPASKQAASSSKQQQAAASSSKQQQQAAASSSKQQQQQAAGKQQQASSSRQAAASKQQASSKQAASKQQPAFTPLKEWTNISFKNQRDTKNWTFSRRTALKQWNRSITKSCDDAKLELFQAHGLPIRLSETDTT